MNKHKIKNYKEVELFYNEFDGNIYFDFEGVERKTKYIFEAEQIIDEPSWKECDLEGYFVDGYIDKYIGTAKAKRIDIKSNKPEWKIKGQYDIEYKTPSFSSDVKIFLKTKDNDIVYKEWEFQRSVYHQELRKLNNITCKLK